LPARRSRRCGACVLCARRADDRIAGRRRRRERGFIRDAYVKNLRAGDHKIVSHYDATFAVDDPNPESETARGPDPFLDGFIRAYGSAFVAYARDELGFKTEMTYNLLASDISGKWDWQDGGGHSPPSAPRICASCSRSRRHSGS
jgi:carboxypeptidase C (cathepsin A)